MKPVLSVATPIIFLLTSLAILSSTLTPPTAQAIPAFARKYAVNCTVCHVRPPRLNRFGERFLENGYQLPGTEDGGIIGKVRYGDLTLDQVSKYIGILFQTNVVKHDTRKRDVAGLGDRTELVNPATFLLFTAGTITNNVGVLADMVTGSSFESVELARSFITFNNIGGQNLAHTRIGRFDPSAYASYARLRQQFSSSPAAFTNKFSGLFSQPGTPLSPSSSSLYNTITNVGIDIHGRPFGNWFLYQIGLLNGAEERWGDTNNSKDWYVMTRFDFAESDYFSANLSGFAYFGNHNAQIASGTDVSRSQYGVTANLRYKIVDLYGAFIVDRLTDLPESVDSQFDNSAMGITLEADVLASDRMLFGLRYDHVDAGGIRTQRTSRSTIAMMAKYYLRTNIAVFLQDNINLRQAQGGRSPERNLRNEFFAGIFMAY